MLHPASAFLRRDPFSVFRTLDEGFGRGQTRGYPAVNVWQGAESAVVTAEVPGVDAESIDISVNDGTLVISGERRSAEPDGKGVWHLRERASGRFVRSLRLPFSPGRIGAETADGVLKITLHRRDEDKPRRIRVKAA